MSEGGVGRSDNRRGRLRIAGAVASVVLVVTAVTLAIVDGSGSGGEHAPDTSPHLVEVSDLTSLEASLGHPIYWAGERPPDELELKEEVEGSVYLRYLPPGVEAGDPEQRFLTVGTYPVPDAVAALRRTAVADGTSPTHARGAVVLPNPASRGSVYLAYPGSDIQIEVYDPTPGRSLELIRSGAIGPVGG